eukprot:10233686-Karenia_brevis.AAC.1
MAKCLRNGKMYGITSTKFKSMVGQWRVKDPPTAWIHQEQIMGAAVKSGNTLAADNKNPGRAWKAD